MPHCCCHGTKMATGVTSTKKYDFDGQRKSGINTDLRSSLPEWFCRGEVYGPSAISACRASSSSPG
jgi:hypothetical protein